jgi:ethanolamine utilization protein EutN
MGVTGLQLAKVLGQVVSTVKEPGLERFTLLLLQDATGADPERSGGPSYVAVDLVGAGVGEIVLVVAGGAARVAAGADSPTDRAVVAIADTVIRGGTVTYRKT